MQLQVTVGGEAEDGGRPLAIHSRPEPSGSEDEEEAGTGPWAQGVLSAAEPATAPPFEAWPPAAAEPIEVDSIYDRLAEPASTTAPPSRD